MFRELQLTNFKNFRDATLELGPFTVLVGANASGKSNLRDAFRFLHGIGRDYGLTEILEGKTKGSGEKPGTRFVEALQTSLVKREILRSIWKRTYLLSTSRGDIKFRSTHGSRGKTENLSVSHMSRLRSIAPLPRYPTRFSRRVNFHLVIASQ